MTVFTCAILPLCYVASTWLGPGTPGPTPHRVAPTYKACSPAAAQQSPLRQRHRGTVGPALLNWGRVWPPIIIWGEADAQTRPGANKGGLARGAPSAPANSSCTDQKPGDAECSTPIAAPGSVRTYNRILAMWLRVLWLTPSVCLCISNAFYK